MEAKIIVGANLGDEGKGTVTARYAMQSDGRVLNVLTNGGAQRGHSVLKDGNYTTFQHFGSGTCVGADSYYSIYYILNPIQFKREYDTLIIKPKRIIRDKRCRWSTPYDSMANIIEQTAAKSYASCGMGIWNTIKRYSETKCISFDDFIALDEESKIQYLKSVKQYYEMRTKDIMSYEWQKIWSSENIILHFIYDCNFMYSITEVSETSNIITSYDSVIFENGQGLMLSDRGLDESDRTPSKTGIEYAMNILNENNISKENITAHYVTRSYMTRHGYGFINSETERTNISTAINEDFANHFNDNQGEFRYGILDISKLSHRIKKDAGDVKFKVEVTHCDEVDRESEFRKEFNNIEFYDKAEISPE